MTSAARRRAEKQEMEKTKEYICPYEVDAVWGGCEILVGKQAVLDHVRNRHPKVVHYFLLKEFGFTAKNVVGRPSKKTEKLTVLDKDLQHDCPLDNCHFRLPHTARYVWTQDLKIDHITLGHVNNKMEQTELTQLWELEVQSGGEEDEESLEDEQGGGKRKNRELRVQVKRIKLAGGKICPKCNEQVMTKVFTCRACLYNICKTCSINLSACPECCVKLAMLPYKRNVHLEDLLAKS